MNDKTILTIERIFLAVIGIIFMASGIFTFFDPHTMGQALGIAPMNASGETEIRATYGGLVVGSGLLVLAGLFSRLMAVAALAGTFFWSWRSDVHPNSHSGHGRVHHQPGHRRCVRTIHGGNCVPAAQGGDASR